MSLRDLICYLEEAVKYADIRKVAKQTREGCLKGLLCHAKVEAVSCDLERGTDSSTFDAGAVIASSDHVIKVHSLVQNTFSYINKVMDIMDYMTSKERGAMDHAPQ